jgi:hypothetical protein
MKPRVFVLKLISTYYLIVISILILLSGCSHLSVNKVDGSFNGIAELYKNSKGVKARDSLSVLIVHGIGVHPDDYSNRLQTGIATKLGMEEKNDSFEKFDILLNDYKIAKLIRRTFESKDNKKLYFVEMNWSYGTIPIKEHFLNIDPNNKFIEKGELEKHRLKINSFGKSMVNEKFSDAIIYSGNFKHSLQYAVSQAICWTLTKQDSTKANNYKCDFNQNSSGDDIVLISASLGSAMVFDTVDHYKPELMPDEVPDQKLEIFNARMSEFAGKTSHIFMMANQLPLFELSMLEEPKGSNWPESYSKDQCDVTKDSETNTSISEFIRKRNLFKANAKLQASQLQVVAFSDPNDLLTYEVTQRFKDSCKSVNFVNATVTNAPSGYLFVLANPISAHVDFDKNNNFFDLVVNGH